MKKLLITTLIALIITIPTAFAGNEAGGPAKISADELKSLKDKGEVVIIDSRGGKYFDGEVIEGAKNLPVDSQTAEALAEIAPDKGGKLVFYCQNTACNASELGAYKAKDAGYNNVFKYPGGIEEWKSKGYPTSKL